MWKCFMSDLAKGGDINPCSAAFYSLLCIGFRFVVLNYTYMINTFIGSISVRLSSENLSHFTVLINIVSLNLNTLIYHSPCLCLTLLT
jgi:hypothetical protein